MCASKELGELGAAPLPAKKELMWWSRTLYLVSEKETKDSNYRTWNLIWAQDNAFYCIDGEKKKKKLLAKVVVESASFVIFYDWLNSIMGNLLYFPAWGEKGGVDDIQRSIPWFCVKNLKGDNSAEHVYTCK